MIQVTFYKNRQDGYCGFRFIGHAEYAEAGEDVVCAGVSALVINTVNCIDKLTDDRFTIDSDADTGLIELQLTDSVSQDTALLLKALLIGCQGISNDYGTDYVKIHCKEV
ncbi:MAG: ribosomal-processing cysteine protease Prp [Lachnospiraceae bacterium]|nr:ribosomal-processing cysteine protease Prp [Lachnospiraceae bacterium]